MAFSSVAKMQEALAFPYSKWMAESFDLWMKTGHSPSDVVTASVWEQDLLKWKVGAEPVPDHLLDEPGYWNPQKYAAKPEMAKAAQTKKVVLSSDRYRCPYCGSLSFDDHRGNCCCCGGPR